MQVYGADPDDSTLNFGQSVYFSSLWRYECIKDKVEAWGRINKKVGMTEIVELLQTAAHGSTEHSVVWQADDSKIFGVGFLICDRSSQYSIGKFYSRAVGCSLS